MEIKDIKEKLNACDLIEQDRIHDNQWQAASEVVDKFNSHHYVILKAQCQSGKTGVIMACANIISIDDDLRSSLGIKQMVYLVGTDDKEIKSQTEEDKGRVYYPNIDFDICKRHDLIHYDYLKTSKNTLFFIDESHYGTSKEQNKVCEYLNKCGVDYMHGGSILNENNNYILSVSATPWNEMISDIAKKKPIVKLNLGEDYKGVDDFYKNNQFYPLESNIMKEEYACSQFFEHVIYPYLDEQYHKTGFKKCAFVRYRENTKYPIDYNNMLCKKFNIINFSGDKINYPSLYNFIKEQSLSKSNEKYPLVLIKGTFRMGKRIDNLYKKYICCIYDFSTSINSSVTEQGLLGRMCGWRDKDDNSWKDVKFYISQKHYNYIINNYIENKTSTPMHELKSSFIGVKKFNWKSLHVNLRYNYGDNVSYEVLSTKSLSNRSKTTLALNTIETNFRKCFSDIPILRANRRVNDKFDDRIRDFKAQPIHQVGSFLTHDNIGKECFLMYVKTEPECCYVSFYSGKIEEIAAEQKTFIKPTETMITCA